MAAISGKSGTVKAGASTVAEVTKWTFDPQCAVPKYNSNNTGGYKTGVAGVFDGKGTVEVKLDPAVTLDFLVGQSVTLELHIDDTAANYYSVPAIISGAPIECDIDGGEIVGVTYNFEASGAWTANGAVA